MYIIGTAGHVDHGKSSLVKALTDIDPDRLQEEKDRELTIDLGYAWFDLPDHKNVSIVDVPGHEKFINNMLAGVGSIDMALVVIAADESIMPQTREHIAILDLLKIKNGAIAITKTDLVEKEMVDLVKEDIREAVQGSFLENVSVVTVSTKTGDGLNTLKAVINENLSNIVTPQDIGQPRLSIDRSFSMDGFGTIVTGNLRDGHLVVGQEIEIVNSGKRSRIRALQTHGSEVNKAMPGSRVALNLPGISAKSIRRGEVVADIGTLSPTNAFDIHLKLLKNLPNNVKHNMFVNVHLGTDQQIGKLRLLDCDIAESGQQVWAQIKLKSGLVTRKNDYCIIRSNQVTLGGGIVVEPHAKRHKRNHTKTIESLNLKRTGSVKDLVILSTDKLNPVQINSMVKETHLHEDVVKKILPEMIKSKTIVKIQFNKISYYQSLSKFEEQTERIKNNVSDYHKVHPSKLGLPKNQLNNRLNMSSENADLILNTMVTTEEIIIENGYIRLSHHTPELSNNEEADAQLFMSILKENKYSPPTNSLPSTEIIENLILKGKIIKINEKIYYDAEIYKIMLSKFVDFLNQHEQINISQVKELFDISRKYALAFAEHMDQKQISKRIGDIRILKTAKREVK
ncbi:MAG: selenocysteine-specific translation elongation factor [Dehalococcoidia bacterium]|nr:selenocysteine-specific translation elongation factor [Dehalococcoidia bacterium]MQG16353.1 selenocysteine-specific translation elongation factor [SAR202 cluster bacterium]|tara:strand:- start:893 stop:2767 length:1875 start_codon:yes stop_codon:yes gene_type:complete